MYLQWKHDKTICDKFLCTTTHYETSHYLHVSTYYKTSHDPHLSTHYKTSHDPHLSTHYDTSHDLHVFTTTRWDMLWQTHIYNHAHS